MNDIDRFDLLRKSQLPSFIAKKKAHQVYCGNDFMVNDWLLKNQDVEIVDIKLTGTRDEELVMVIYKIELEEVE